MQPSAEYALSAYVIGWEHWRELKDAGKFSSDPVIQERFDRGWKDRDTFEYCKRKDHAISQYGRPCRMVWRNAVTEIR